MRIKKFQDALKSISVYNYHTDHVVRQYVGIQLLPPFHLRHLYTLNMKQLWNATAKLKRNEEREREKAEKQRMVIQSKMRDFFWRNAIENWAWGSLLINRNQNIMIGNDCSFSLCPISEYIAFMPHTSVMMNESNAVNIPMKFKSTSGNMNDGFFCLFENIIKEKWTFFIPMSNLKCRKKVQKLRFSAYTDNPV